VDFPGTNDVIVIELTGEFGKLTVINVYNDGTHSQTLTLLHDYFERNIEALTSQPNSYYTLQGDFNRHHPDWDGEENSHLFTPRVLCEAEPLLDILNSFNLEQALPKGIPTFLTSRHGTRPDNLFVSENLMDHTIECDVRPELQLVDADHTPISLTLDIPVTTQKPIPRRNFRDVDWKQFNVDLGARLQTIPKPRPLHTKDQLEQATLDLTKVTQNTIEKEVPLKEMNIWSRRWWNLELTRLKKAKNRANAAAYKKRANKDHPIHREAMEKRRKFKQAVEEAKNEHWEEYIDNIDPQTVFALNKYTDQSTDISPTVIPSLVIDATHPAQLATTNEEKAEVLAKAFFPAKPVNLPTLDEMPRANRLKDPTKVTEPKIHEVISSLSPYKAPGPDGIPNIVLMKTAHLIVPYIVQILQAIRQLLHYSSIWLEFTMIVLRKGSRPTYRLAKSYHPIALLNSLQKVDSGVTTNELSYLAEKYNLLPKMQFGGRPNRMTTDALHLLVDKVHNAWRNKRKVSVLSLDIEGAFPNAMRDRLLYNMRKRRVPEALVNHVKLMLTGQRTRLKFGDYTSRWFDIQNGIPQGDPLSMILYLFYSADFYDIKMNKRGCTIGFVDDKLVVVEGDSLETNVKQLEEFMMKEDGALEWSRDHNSRFELSKLALIHFTRTRSPDPSNPKKMIPKAQPNMTIGNEIIKAKNNFRYLGVILDRELRWREQRAAVIAKGERYVNALRRLTRYAIGLKTQYVRQLYLTVAIPKLTYGLDVWYTPPKKKADTTWRTGSVAALAAMAKIQRKALIAMTGALATAPTDLLELHSDILPIDLLLEQACFRAMMRICTLPKEHPLNPPTRDAYRRKDVKQYPSPMRNLFKLLQIPDPNQVEKMTPPQRNTSHKPSFTTNIATTAEEAIEDEKEDKSPIKVYVDGSGKDGKVGAAAILLQEGESPVKLHYHLGPLTKHTTFDAEAIGTLLGIHLLQGLPPNLL
jgi:hypothetical protein